MAERRWAQAPCRRDQFVLFPHYVDEVVGADDPIRLLDELLARLDWSDWEARYDGHRGQPAIHPRLLAGSILFGLMCRVRSSRALEEATRKRVDFLWFLEGRTIDHATFAHFRTAFGEALKGLNRQIGKLICEERGEGLLGLVIDGTRVRADSDRHGARTAEGLARLVKACVEELDKRLAQLEEADAQEDAGPRLAALEAEIEELREKVKKYETALAVAQARDAVKQEALGKKATPVRVPVTDPEAQVTPNKEGGFAPNYTPVVAADATTGHVVYADVLAGSEENAAVLPAVAEARDVQGQSVSWVAADSGLASGETLEGLAEQGVDASMPTNTDFRAENPAQRPDPTQAVADERVAALPRKNGKFSQAAFVYDAAQDRYYCPAGQALLPTGHGRYARTGIGYTKYQCPGCANCPLAAQCVKEGTPFRTLHRDQYQAYREQTGRRMATPEGKQIYRRRAPVAEGVFAGIKHLMGIRRFLLRGLAKVRIEWDWICGAFNLKRLMQLMRAAGHPTQSTPPTDPTGPMPDRSGTEPAAHLNAGRLGNPPIHRAPWRGPYHARRQDHGQRLSWATAA